MNWASRFANACARQGLDVALGVAGASVCTWRVGGPLGAVAAVRTEQELRVVAECLPESVATCTVGRGSNLLVADAGFDGLVLRLTGDFEHIDLTPAAPWRSLALPLSERSSATPSNTGDAQPQIAGSAVRAGGGVALPVLARRSAAAGHAGLEFFVGIPGSVGGAVRMNAGGHGAETGDVLETALVFHLGDGTTESRAGSACQFGYRASNIDDRSVIMEAQFRTVADDPTDCTTRIDEIVAWRRAHQPGGANAGSVFTNPTGVSAGQLIDDAGCKGMSIRGAHVSAKHANFIQTEDGATANDVVALIALVQARVLEHSGVALYPEVHRLGFENPQRSDRNMRS